MRISPPRYRRYADLVVHAVDPRPRAWRRRVAGDETVETLTEVAAQISVTEPRAMKAERETPIG